MNLKNRKGSVKIRKELFEDALNGANKLLEHLFKDFFPTGIGYIHFEDSFVYYGYSSQFEEKKEGEKIPEYEGIVTIDKSLGCDLHTVNFKKIA